MANKVPSHTFSSSFPAFLFYFIFILIYLFFSIQLSYTKASTDGTGPMGVVDLTIATGWITKRVNYSNKNRGEGRTTSPPATESCPREEGL